MKVKKHIKKVYLVKMNNNNRLRFVSGYAKFNIGTIQLVEILFTYQ